MEVKTVNIEKGYDGKPIVFRVDTAKKVYEPKVIEISGTIGAPGEWIDKRKKAEENEADGVHITYSMDKGWIKLVCNERSNFGTTITGTIEVFSDLTAFKINQPGSTWHPKELATFLKMHRIYCDKEQNVKIIANLKKFKAQVTQKIEDYDNDRGTQKKVFEQDIKTEMEMTFDLTIPLFKGGDNEKFKVEICYDVSSNGIVYWFESPDLKELIDRQRLTMMEKELSKFRKEYVVIEV